jgi:hypothetical protein
VILKNSAFSKPRRRHGGLEVCDYDTADCFTAARLYEDADGDHPDERLKPLVS